MAREEGLVLYIQVLVGWLVATHARAHVQLGGGGEIKFLAIVQVILHAFHSIWSGASRGKQQFSTTSQSPPPFFLKLTIHGHLDALPTQAYSVHCT